MRLLKLEWLKLKKYRTFYILTGLFLLVYILFNVAVNQGAFNITSTNAQGVNMNVVNSDYSFPKVWGNMAYYYGWCIIFICVLVITLIANDYRYKTQRQHIIDGQSRMDYLHSKVVLVLGINVALTLLYTLLCLVFGYINGGGYVLSGTKNIAYVFLYGLNYLSFAALLALLIKRSGLAIVLLMAFVLFEELAVWLLDKFVKIDIAKFSPLDCSDGLLVKPLDGMGKMILGGSKTSSEFMIMIVMSFVWVLIYYFIARLRMQKADL